MWYTLIQMYTKEWNIECHIHFPNKIERKIFTTTVVGAAAADTVFSSSFYFYFYSPLSLVLLVDFSTRKSHPSIQFYDEKKWVFDVCAIVSDGNGKKLFQINSKCRLNDCCCRFYCPYFHRQHYHTMAATGAILLLYAFLRIGNRFMSFYFHFYPFHRVLNVMPGIWHRRQQRIQRTNRVSCAVESVGVCHFHFRSEKHSNYVLMPALKTLSYYILVNHKV